MIRQRLSQISLICLLVWGLHTWVPAQNMKPVTSTYAIVGATIEQAPGKTLEKGTILVKDGIIREVGTNVRIPGEAQIIRADSLFVYAGFIDMYSHAGIPVPENRDRSQPQIPDPSTPPNDLAGITPEVQVRDVLKAEDKSLADLRNLGFAISHVAPRGGMLPGSGSLVILGGEHPDKMILKGETAQIWRFAPAQRVYPATLLGVMAKWRELYKQAEQSLAHEKLYAQRPNGTPRPTQDRVLQAFFPVLDKKIPVYFVTENLLAISRALTLQKELGFNVVLANVKEASDGIPALKGKNIPLALSLELPKEEKAAKDATVNQNAANPLEKEKLALQQRKDQAIKAAQAQAGNFAKEGIAFGFSTATVKSGDIRSNLRSMIKQGLSEDGALAALTTVPARLLGISDIAGTVDPGKMANLVLTQKPYFHEKSDIRMVMVDGKLYEMEKKATPSNKTGEAGEMKKVLGTWSYTSQTPQGESTGILTLKNEGGKLTGTVTNNFVPGEIPIEDASIDGDDLSFRFTVDLGGNSLSIKVDAILDENTFEGTMSAGAMGLFPIKGEKKPNN